MASTTSTIGSSKWIAPQKFNRRSLAPHKRGRKKLGPKSCMRGDKGKH